MLLSGSRHPALLIGGSAYLSRRIITVTTWSEVDPDVKTGSAPRTPGVHLQGRFAESFEEKEAQATGKEAGEASAT